MAISTITGASTGSTGTVITTGSSGQVIPKAALPTGSVLQVVQASYATNVSTSGTTYIDTNLSASITPTSSTSKILILITQSVQNTNTSGYATCKFRLLRDATEIYGPANTSNGNIFTYDYGNSGVNIFRPVSINWLDSPSTTSELVDRKSTRLNSSHSQQSRMPSSA